MLRKDIMELLRICPFWLLPNTFSINFFSNNFLFLFIINVLGLGLGHLGLVLLLLG